MNRLVCFKVPDMEKQPVNLFHTFLHRPDFLTDGNGLCAGFIQIGVKALHGGNLFLPQEIKGFHDLVEIANSAFQLPLGSPAGAFLTPHIQIPGKQFGDGRLLCLFQCFQQRRFFLFQAGQPAL